MPITGEWAGTPVWEPAKLPTVKVGKYGAATAKIDMLYANRSMSGKGYKWVELVVPTGGLNQWSADELRAFAAVILAAADDADTHPLPYRTDN